MASENSISRTDERINRELQAIEDVAVQHLLTEWTRNLTALARIGELAIKGEYDVAVERALTVLGRRRARNILLISDSGSATEAVVAGVAYRIANGQSPQTLHDKEIITFDCEPDDRQAYEKHFKTLIKYSFSNSWRVIPRLNYVTLLVHPETYPEVTSIATLLRVLVRHGLMQFIVTITPQDYRQNIPPHSLIHTRDFISIFLD